MYIVLNNRDGIEFEYISIILLFSFVYKVASMLVYVKKSFFAF